MLSFTVLFAVSVLWSNVHEAHSVRLNDLQLDTELESLLQRIQGESRQQRREPDSAPNDRGSNEILNLNEIFKLTQEAVNPTIKALDSNREQRYREEQRERANRKNRVDPVLSAVLSPKNRQYSFKSEDRDDVQSNIASILSSIFSQSRGNRGNRDRVPVSSNSNLVSQLLDTGSLRPREDRYFRPPSIVERDPRDDSPAGVSDLSQYSQIFVVLNPKALKKDNDKDAISNLVSLLSSSSQNDRSDRKQGQPRYRGFVVNSHARRINRDETDDRGEQKRYRQMDMGLGGGGAAGRTAIPYIRHRGDIYERDHN